MKKIFLISLITFGSLSFASVARKYTDCDRSSLKSPKEASDVYFDEACKNAYVLPPRFGQATYKAAKFSKASKCEAIMAPAKSYLAEMNRIRSRLNAIGGQSDGSSSTPPVSKQCEKEQTNLAFLESQILSVESTVANLKSELTNLQTELRSCSGSRCESVKIRVMTVESKIRTQQMELDRLKQAKAITESKVAACSSRNNSPTPVASESERLDLLERLTLYSQKYLEAIKPYENEQGIIMQVTMENTHADLVEEYRRLNKGVKNKDGIEYNFVAMPIRATVHYYSDQIANVSGQTILSARIPGLAAKFDYDEINMLADRSASDFVIMGSSLAGDLHFSLPQSCELYDLDPTLQNLDSHLALNVNYTYQVQAGKVASISYAMNDIYEYIKRVSSKRRFFKSSSSVSITELIKNNDTIKIKISNEDNQNKWNKDDIEFAMQLRANAMSLAFDTVGATYTREVPDIKEPPSPAAPEVAQALRRIPLPLFQRGAVLIDSVSALFGGSEATASYSRHRHTTVNETIEVHRPIVEPGTYTFRLKSE